MASWDLSTDKGDLTEADLQHIADQITKGFTSGDLVDEDEE